MKKFRLAIRVFWQMLGLDMAGANYIAHVCDRYYSHRWVR